MSAVAVQSFHARSPLASLVALLIGLSVSSGPQNAPSNGLYHSSAKLVVQTGHATDVYSFAFSPDGQTLASSSNDGVLLWDVASGFEVRALATGVTCSIAFSPDGKTVGLGCRDRTILFFDVSSGKELRVLAAHSDVDTVAFSPDGKTLASSDGYNVKLWDVQSGKEVRALACSGRSIAWSPDGKTLAATKTVEGSNSVRVELWDVASGKKLRALAGQSQNLYCVTFSPDGKKLAGGSGSWGNGGRSIKLWDVATGKELCSFVTGSRGVTSVAFSPDGKTLASGSCGSGKLISLWDANSGEELRSFGAQRRALAGVKVAWSPDGKTVAGTDQQYIDLWDPSNGKHVQALGAHRKEAHWDDACSVAWSPDGKTLASGSNDKSIKLWPLAPGKILRVLPEQFDVTSIAFSPDGKTLASTRAYDVGPSYINNAWHNEAREQKQVQLLDVASGRELRSFAKQHSWVDSLKFDVEGKTLASNNGDLWEVASGKQLGVSPRHVDWEDSIAFMPNGKAIVLGGVEVDSLRDHRKFIAQKLKVWDVSSDKELLAFPQSSFVPEFPGEFGSFALSSDGKTVAISDDSNKIRLWDVDSGKVLRTLAGPLDGFAKLVFSPDATMLATCGRGTIKLLDVASGKELGAFTDHGARINSVAWSPDGKTLATSSDDMTVRLWNIDSAREVAALYSFGRSDWAVVTPEGYFEASPGGMQMLHWRSNNHIVDSDQLRQHFLMNGLLQKALTSTLPAVR